MDIVVRTLFPSDAMSDTSAATSSCYLLIHPDDVADGRELALPTLRSRKLRCRLPVPALLGPLDRVAIYWGSQNADWIFGELDRLRGAGPIILIKGPPSSVEKADFFADDVAEVIDIAATPTLGAVV
jgi:hypothetical protein